MVELALAIAWLAERLDLIVFVFAWTVIIGGCILVWMAVALSVTLARLKDVERRLHDLTDSF